MKRHKKKRYDLIGVQMALAKCANGKKGNRLETRYYFCVICNAYHLTSESELKYLTNKKEYQSGTNNNSKKV